MPPGNRREMWYEVSLCPLSYYHNPVTSLLLFLIDMYADSRKKGKSSCFNNAVLQGTEIKAQKYNIFTKSAILFLDCTVVKMSILTKNPESLPKKYTPYFQLIVIVKQIPGGRNKKYIGKRIYIWREK